MQGGTRFISHWLSLGQVESRAEEILRTHLSSIRFHSFSCRSRASELSQAKDLQKFSG